LTLFKGTALTDQQIYDLKAGKGNQKKVYNLIGVMIAHQDSVKAKQESKVLMDEERSPCVFEMSMDNRSG
jgi:hypothetical protein